MPITLGRRKSHDSVTGLPERDTFYAQADRLCAKSESGELSIAFARVIGMKEYNLQHGIAARDELLKSVADSLIGAFPKGIVAFYLIDTFLVIAPTNEIEAAAEQVSDALVAFDEHGDLSAKVGCCVCLPNLSAQETSKRAQFACASIRYERDVFFRWFDADLEVAYDRRAYVVAHIDDAVKSGEIKVFYQPIVRVLTGQVCEAEALARWESKHFGFLRPDEFVGELETHRLIHKLDCEMIRQAAENYSIAREQGVNVPFGINLSRLDFELCDIFSYVDEQMKAYNVPKDRCHIEVTESALSSDYERLWNGIRQFRDAGYTIYMDDFGSGYSSLRVLDETVFDVVKLDMSLIADVEENERARVIVSDTVSMVKRLGMQTLCEGVETKEQLVFLRRVGCEKAQGYLFGKPMPAVDMFRLLKADEDTREEPIDEHYLDAVGEVNLQDGTRASVEGVESGSFFGHVPIAVVEMLGQRVECLSSNVAFTHFLLGIGLHAFDDLLSLVNGGYGEMRTKMSYAASKAKATGQEASIDFIANGHYCNMTFEHIVEAQERDAYLVRAFNVSSAAMFENTVHLEESLRFLYSIYQRIDLFDLEDNHSRNIYINSPQYRGSRAEGMLYDEIGEFCELNVHPDDRARFLEFYDLSTLDERIAAEATDHVSCSVRVKSDTGRYIDGVFMLIPMMINGRKQVLSSLRDLDVRAELGAVSGDTRISDTVLLSGVLDAVSRNIFWKDDKRRFLGANQAFLDYYGFESIDAILGKTDEDMGWHEDNEPFKLDEYRVLEGEHVRHARGSCYAKGVLHQIEANKLPLYREGKIVGLVGYFDEVED